MPLPTVHEELEQIAGGKAAIGVKYYHLGQLSAEYFRRLVGVNLLQNLPIPTTQLAVTLSLARSPAAVFTPGSLDVTFSDLELKVNLHETGDETAFLATISFVYASIDARLEVNARAQNQIVCVLQGASSPIVAETRNPNGSQLDALVDAHFQGTTLTAKYEQFALFLYMVRFNAASEVVSSFLRAYQLPNVIASMGNFKLQAPFDLHTLTDYLVVASDHYEVMPKQGCVAAEEKIQLPVTVYPPIEVPEGGYKIPSEAVLRPGEERLPPVSVFEAPEYVMFLPNDPMFKFSFEKVKPSITVAESGGWFIFYWEYNVTAALREGSVSVHFSIASILAKIKAALEIYGTVGAGVTIACIRYEVLGAKLGGKVDPLSFDVQPVVDRSHNRVYLAARAAEARAEITINSRQLFPLDKVAEFVLNRIYGNVINRAIESRVNQLQVPLFNLEDLGPIRQNISSASHSKSPDSAVIGVGCSIA